MTTTTFPAGKLLSAQRIELAIQALAGVTNVSHLAAENEVSRKFIYRQKTKARDALEDAFGANAALQLNGGELQFQAAQLFHVASTARR